jgi:hypothetical protein
MQVKSLETFTPVMPTDPVPGDVSFRYTWGNPIQLQGMTTDTTACQYGDRYPAPRTRHWISSVTTPTRTASSRTIQPERF